MPTAKKRKISSRNTTRKTGKMNNLIQVINHDFQEVLRGRKDPTQHLFFENIIWWKKHTRNGLPKITLLKLRWIK